MTLEALQDRIAITDVLAGLARWLDDKRWDHADEVLTADVRVTTPGGTAEGREATVAQARRNHGEVTQHLFTNVVVDLAGDRADVGAESLVAIGAQRRVGSRYALGFVRTPSGWRIDALTVTPVWDTNPPSSTSAN
jgi:SnoaL-like domain